MQSKVHLNGFPLTIFFNHFSVLIISEYRGLKPFQSLLNLAMSDLIFTNLRLMAYS